MKITNNLRKNIYQALDSMGLAGAELQTKEQDILLEHPADKSHGDYSTNIALVLFSKLKKEGAEESASFNSPRDLAQAVVDQLQKLAENQASGQVGGRTSDSEFTTNISKIEIAGPGFINFTLSDAFLLAKMGSVLENRGDIMEKDLSGEKVMIEFTDPNPFKELHIGHLYSNIVGEAIAKSYEALGADVNRACYQGDVGMHVSKSVWGMKALLAKNYAGKTAAEALTELESKPLSEKVNFLGKSYATGATAYKDDEVAQKNIQDINYLIFISAQENLKDTTGFEPQVDYKKFSPSFSEDSRDYLEIKQLYAAGRKWSLDYFDSMYSRIGMGFDEFFFESLVGEYGYQIVGEFLAKGVFEKSDGAIIFPGSKHDLHDRVFINSLGFPTYEAKELGLAPEKFRRFPYDKSIVITGNEIDEYFKVLMKALEFTNPDLQKKTTHLSHGMVRLPEGKMSSRTGKVITAEWLMNEAHDRIKNHMLETRSDFTEAEIDEASEFVGLGAIKFAFLKQSIGKDITFSFDESLSFSGNSGPYVQYTYVRCQSVISKAQNEMSKSVTAEDKVGIDGSNSGNDGRNEQQNSEELKTNSSSPNSEAGNNINEYFDTLINLKSYLKFQQNNEEKDILRNLYRYSDVLRSATNNYEPHQIAGFLYELAQSFNVFYGKHRVVDSENNKETSDFRLLLVQSVAYVLKHGLNILGIKTIKKM